MSVATEWLNHKHNTGCKHNWRYEGHSHNDDCYVCTICNIMEWY